MKSPSSIVIFTDLDGTLLDGAYCFDAAGEALRLIAKRNIPLVLCSSKTRREIEVWRNRLGNRHPFISENGGGIFIPAGYFSAGSMLNRHDAAREGEYFAIRLGTSYQILCNALHELRAEGFAVTGFCDLSAEEIAGQTGMLLADALLAKEREFDEPFRFHGTAHEMEKLLAWVRARGLSLTRGDFFHLMGNSNKGNAAGILAGLYREQLGRITIIALGDRPNDIPMLEQADFRVVVADSRGSHDLSLQLPGLIREPGSGPVGWNRAVIELLEGLLD